MLVVDIGDGQLGMQVAFVLLNAVKIDLYFRTEVYYTPVL